MQKKGIELTKKKAWGRPDNDHSLRPHNEATESTRLKTFLKKGGRRNSKE